VPIEVNFWRFLENLNPRCCRPSSGPQKGISLRHNARFEPLCVKLHPRVTSVSDSGKKKLKREALYFTSFARRSLTVDWHKFWVTCSPRGCKTDCLQILYKFCKNWISVPNILSLRCKYRKIHSCGNFQDAINSIRCSAAERLQANVVSLLWRHSSWVRSQTIEHAYSRPFLTVFQEFKPQNVVGHRVDPKKALPYVTTRVFEPLCVKFHARVTSVGGSGEKIKIKI